MSARFPRLSADGRVASGSGTIIVDEQVVGVGFEPQWYKPGILLVKGFYNDDRPHTIDLATQVDTPLAPNGPMYSHLRAGGGTWIGAEDRSPLFKVACSRGGQRAWLIEHGGNNNDHSLLLDTATGVVEVARGSVHNPRVEDGLLVWTEDGGIRQRTMGRWTSGRIVRLHASGDLWEGTPIPVMTPQGPWVVVITNLDIRAYPWGETRGHIIATGEDENREPDALWLNGAIVVVWSDKNGTLPPRTARLTLDAPRVELNAAPPIVIPPPPPPPPAPPPPIPEPPMPDQSLAALVAICVAAGREIDRRFPGLRQKLTMEWIAKTADLASKKNKRIGHSSSHSDSTPNRRNELGILPEGAKNEIGRQNYTAVSLWRINPPTDEWRDPVITEDRHDFWFPAQPTDIGTDPDPEPDPELPHAYDGEPGGRCRVCGQTEGALVHRGDSVEPHAFEGTGELCDRCGEPADNLAFHLPVTPPTDWQAAVRKLEAGHAALVANAGLMEDRIAALEKRVNVGIFQALALAEQRIIALEERPVGVGITTKLVIRGVTLEVEPGP
jgi:hypothetical protein